MPKHLLQFALRGVRHWPVSDEKIGFDYKLKRFVEGCRLSPEQAHVYWNGTFSCAEKSTLLQSTVSTAFSSILGELREKTAADGDLASYLWFDQKYFLPDDILTKVDRMSMAHSLEVRPPFLDHRLVEFAMSLPARYKLQGSRSKRILVHVMRGRLPPETWHRPKHGFALPLAPWFKTALRDRLNAITQYDRSLGALLNPEAVRRLVHEHLSGRRDHADVLWKLLVLLEWERWSGDGKEVRASVGTRHVSSQHSES